MPVIFRANHAAVSEPQPCVCRTWLGESCDTAGESPLCVCADAVHVASRQWFDALSNRGAVPGMQVAIWRAHGKWSAKRLLAIANALAPLVPEHDGNCDMEYTRDGVAPWAVSWTNRLRDYYDICLGDRAAVGCGFEVSCAFDAYEVERIILHLGKVMQSKAVMIQWKTELDDLDERDVHRVVRMMLTVVTMMRARTLHVMRPTRVRVEAPPHDRPEVKFEWIRGQVWTAKHQMFEDHVDDAGRRWVCDASTERFWNAESVIEAVPARYRTAFRSLFETTYPETWMSEELLEF